MWRTGIPPGEHNMQGRTVRWLSLDSEENYVTAGNAYAPEDVSYVFNQHGYRCDEFDTELKFDLKILFLGCSVTMGEGLPLDEVYAHRIVTHLRSLGLKVPYWNAALPGRSVDHAARMLTCMAPVLRPDIVLAYLPDLHRREIFAYAKDGTNHLLNYYANYSNPDFRRYQIAAMTMVFSRPNDLLFARKNLALMNLAAKVTGAAFFWNSWGEDMGSLVDTEDELYSLRFPVGMPNIRPGRAGRNSFRGAVSRGVCRRTSDIFTA
jgi:hypothetical protein